MTLASKIDLNILYLEIEGMAFLLYAFGSALDIQQIRVDPYCTLRSELLH